MKKLFAIAFAAFAFAACGETETEETTVMADTMATTNTTVTTDPAATGMTATTHTPGDGDVTYNSGKVQVYRNNTWEESNEDVTLGNGTVVRKTGRIERDGNEYEYEEGYVIDRDGNVWDRTGNAISNAWDATKYGVKKAGKAVGNAAEKVGEKAKDAVD
ncbi:MAG: hypothetical protein EOP56_13310 [Sphingobacteriales bacterium]|nr:MAG: hypothetical protein EOP56_13310 [Sphingobacteriales bacterium]